jgi:rod shape-determining protein MreD
MLYYLSLPFLSVLLIVLQTAITDIIFSNRFVFEMSLVVVIYAGFRLDLIKGTVLSFVLGLVFDFVSGSVPGVLAFIYIIVFWGSFFVSEWLDTEKTYVIVSFGFLCALLKEILLNSFYYLAFNINALTNVSSVIFIQALVIGLLAPLFFSLMDRTGILLYEKRV